MKYKCAFIGCGNMGGALLRAAVKTLPPELVCVSNRSPEKAQRLAAETGAAAVTNQEAAAQAEYVFLGVKPQMLPSLISDIGGILRGREDSLVLVSMAAAVTTEKLTQMLGAEYPVIRIMPNTPVSVGAGMILYAPNARVDERQLSGFLEIMSRAGVLDRLEERLIDAGSAVSGCGPAFACMFMEALADGGVQCGLPRDKAMMYAAQMLLGSARLLLESGVHPGALKDAVCSPGGTTIVGVHELEKAAFRGAVSGAVIAAYEKTIELAGR